MQIIIGGKKANPDNFDTLLREQAEKWKRAETYEVVDLTGCQIQVIRPIPADKRPRRIGGGHPKKQ